MEFEISGLACVVMIVPMITIIVSGLWALASYRGKQAEQFSQ